MDPLYRIVVRTTACGSSEPAKGNLTGRGPVRQGCVRPGVYVTFFSAPSGLQRSMSKQTCKSERFRTLYEYPRSRSPWQLIKSSSPDNVANTSHTSINTRTHRLTR